MIIVGIVQLHFNVHVPKTQTSEAHIVQRLTENGLLANLV